MIARVIVGDLEMFKTRQAGETDEHVLRKARLKPLRSQPIPDSLMREWECELVFEGETSLRAGPEIDSDQLPD